MAQQPPPQQQQQQPLPVPNIPNLHAAVTGMTTAGQNMAQELQTYNAHQQVLTTKLSRCANYDAAQIQLQLAAIRRDIAESRALNSAE
jgi:hypothetical protein